MEEVTCPTAGGGGGVGAAWVRFRSRRDSAAAFECRLLALLAPAADPSPEERRFFFARTARPLLLPHAEPPSSDMDSQDPDPAELGVALRRLRCESASDSQELPALPKLRAMSASHFSLRLPDEQEAQLPQRLALPPLRLGTASRCCGVGVASKLFGGGSRGAGGSSSSLSNKLISVVRSSVNGGDGTAAASWSSATTSVTPTVAAIQLLSSSAFCVSSRAAALRCTSLPRRF